MRRKTEKVQLQDRSQTKKNVQLSSPELLRLEFTRREAPVPPTWGRVPLEVGFGISRPSPERLGIELMIEINDIPAFSIAASYRMVLQFGIPGAILDEIDREMHTTGVQLGLTILLPYIREVISTTIVRAGLPALTLPPINLRPLLDSNNITIPPPPSDILDVDQES